MDIEKIEGMAFTCPSSGEVYGTIRKLNGSAVPDSLPADLWTALAIDDCGNMFVMSKEGHICLWDHETDDVTKLTDSFKEFCSHCSQPKEVDLKPGQVISKWVNPDFKPRFE